MREGKKEACKERMEKRSVLGEKGRRKCERREGKKEGCKERREEGSV